MKTGQRMLPRLSCSVVYITLVLLSAFHFSGLDHRRFGIHSFPDRRFFLFLLHIRTSFRVYFLTMRHSLCIPQIGTYRAVGRSAQRPPLTRGLEKIGSSKPIFDWGRDKFEAFSLPPALRATSLITSARRRCASEQPSAARLLASRRGRLWKAARQTEICNRVTNRAGPMV